MDFISPGMASFLVDAVAFVFVACLLWQCVLGGLADLQRKNRERRKRDLEKK